MSHKAIEKVVRREEMEKYVQQEILKFREIHNNEIRRLKHELHDQKKKVEHVTLLFTVFTVVMIGVLWFTYSKEAAWRGFDTRFRLLSDNINSIEDRFHSAMKSNVGGAVRTEIEPLEHQYDLTEQTVNFMTTFIPILPRINPGSADEILPVVEVHGREMGTWNNLINGVYLNTGIKNDYPYYQRKGEVEFTDGLKKTLFLYHMLPGEVPNSQVDEMGEWFIGSQAWTDVSMARIRGGKYSPLTAHTDGHWRLFEGEKHNPDANVRVLRGQLQLYGRGKKCRSPVLASDRASFDDCREMCDVDINCNYITFHESRGWCTTFRSCANIDDVEDKTIATYRLRLSQ